jgi:inhibitor of cysteine peptidase
MATIEVTDGDLSEGLELAVGDRLRLRLAENPTTGIRWQIATAGAGLRVSRDDYEPGGARPPGSAGHRTFELDAHAPGDFRVTLVSKRSWEAIEHRRHDLRVRVR